jgi:hypothetical protein
LLTFGLASNEEGNGNHNQTRSTEEGRQEGGGDYVRFLAAVFRRRAREKNQGNTQNSPQSPL